MVCPYAKVTGLLKKKVVCTLTNTEVNYRNLPCLSGDYKTCPVYNDIMKKKESKEREEVIAPKGEEARPREAMERMVDEAINEAKKFYDPKKGERPPSCYDCLYFSPTTKMCLLLKKKIENPEKPECLK